MIKLSANVSKKVPMPDVEYSSQNFSAGMEIEVGSNSSKAELKEKFRSLYALLATSIEEQIDDAGGELPQNGPRERTRQTVTSRRSRGNGGNGKGGNGSSGGGRAATEAQVRAIYAIADDRGYSKQDLRELMTGAFGVQAPGALSIGQASTLIDTLKNNGKE